MLSMAIPENRSGYKCDICGREDNITFIRHINHLESMMGYIEHIPYNDFRIEINCPHTVRMPSTVEYRTRYLLSDYLYNIGDSLWNLIRRDAEKGKGPEFMLVVVEGKIIPVDQPLRNIGV